MVHSVCASRIQTITVRLFGRSSRFHAKGLVIAVEELARYLAAHQLLCGCHELVDSRTLQPCICTL